jgi:hypothetical protein
MDHGTALATAFLRCLSNVPARGELDGRKAPVELKQTAAGRR